MKAEILAIGTEILLGDIIDTNSQYISKRLAELGIDVYYHSVIGDNEERVKRALKNAFERVDIVITTGGLGPTKDDLSKEMAFEYFGLQPVIHKESLSRIKNYFSKINKEMPKINEKQALFPKEAIIIENDNGTAPGCILNKNNKTIILLPGPPKEMKPMFENCVLPYLKKSQSNVIYSKVLRVMGLGESKAAELIQDIIDKNNNPTIAPYAKDSEMIFRITAKAKDDDEAKRMIEPVEDSIRERLKDNIYAVGESDIESEVAKILIDNNISIATAESCTGGLLSGRLINYPGISEVFLEGAVTYSNDAKMKTINVRKDTLDRYGAVSSKTAEEMAKGIAEVSGARVGLSTTGIAGPGGGTKDKPVGLVYIGMSIDGKTKSRKLNINGNRQKIRNKTVTIILDWLRRELLKNS